jgi:glycosyltransferase involved in cell wall biosynthesis
VRVLAGALDRRAGSHVYHRELITRLHGRGYRVSTVCTDAQGAQLPAGVEVHEIPRPSHRTRRVVWRAAAATEWWTLAKGLRTATLPRPDVVLGGEHLFLQSHHRRFAGVPWLYFPHSLVVDNEIDGYQLAFGDRQITRAVYRHLQRWALGAATCTVRFTRLGVEALKTRYPFAARARFVVNPVGIEIPPEILPRHAFADRPVRLLSMGSLIHRKGLDLSIGALAGLTDARWTYDIVGSGELRADLESLVRTLGLSHRITFHGACADPHDWYQSADLLLVPSRSESLGLVVLEAAARQLPALAFRRDGARFFNVNDEIVDDGADGFLASDPDDLRKVLAGLLAAPDRLLDAGTAARRRVEAVNTWDAHLDRYDSLFEELLSSAGPKNRTRPTLPVTTLSGDHP